MGQKVNPHGLRVGVIKDWDSRWFANKKDFGATLVEDYNLRKRNMGWRPTVRGSVMNPNDHPHGGGEGKSPVGRPGPVTPWGKPALGYKTRKNNKSSDKLIVRRRNGK